MSHMALSACFCYTYCIVIVFFFFHALNKAALCQFHPILVALVDNKHCSVLFYKCLIRCIMLQCGIHINSFSIQTDPGAGCIFRWWILTVSLCSCRTRAYLHKWFRPAFANICCLKHCKFTFEIPLISYSGHHENSASDLSHSVFLVQLFLYVGDRVTYTTSQKSHHLVQFFFF